VAGCDALGKNPFVRDALDSVEGLTYRVQRALAGKESLAPEFSKADIAPSFRANGTVNPENPEYQALAQNGFADWRLIVDGLVENPLSLSLADLKAMPSRTQITRHDCVEGWSCIGEWTGTPLSLVLDQARPTEKARFAVFHCADPMRDGLPKGVTQQYYESLDLVESSHPQTILAYALNGETLPIANGAPMRVRVERQLGYKHPKYVMRIELVESFAHIGGGKGGFWEDQGYTWWGGI